MVGDRVVYSGLDLQGVRLVVWGLRLKDARQVFNDICAMEAAALEVLNAV